MHIEKICPRIYFAKFENQYSMCMTMLRIVEYSSNPMFHKKPFTLESYMDWYSEKIGNGHFDFDKTYYGFAVMSADIRRFIKNFPNSMLCKKEKQFLEMLTEIVGKDKIFGPKSFYVITSFNKEKGIVFKHELAHIIYHINPDYKKDVDSLVKRLSKRIRKEMSDYLVDEDLYTKEEVIDEINARLSTGNHVSTEFKNQVRCSDRVMSNYKDLFNRYSSKYLNGECENAK